jgi:hypothetical protein
MSIAEEISSRIEQSQVYRLSFAEALPGAAETRLIFRLAAKPGAVYLPDADLSAGAATAKCREEKMEEEQIARTSGMLAVFLQNARER